MDIVDQAGPEVLLNGGRAAADPDIGAPGGGESLLQGHIDTMVAP